MAKASGGLGALNVLLGLDTANFSDGITKADEQIFHFHESLQNLAKGALELLAVEEAIRRMVEAGAHAMETAAHLKDLSERTGIAAEELSALSYAADQSGTNLESMVAALDKFATTIAQAQRGASEQKAVFDVMGISLKDANGNLKDTNTLLGEFAEKISGYANGANKVALVRAAFGRSGAELIPLLNEGAEGLDKLKKEAAALGVVWDTETTVQAKQLEDAFTALSATGSAFGKTLLISVMPTLKVFVDWIIKAREESDGLGEGSKNLETAAKGLGVIFATIGWVVGSAAKEIGALAAQITALWNVATAPPDKLIDAFKQLVAIGSYRSADRKKEYEEYVQFLDKVLHTEMPGTKPKAGEGGGGGEGGGKGKPNAPPLPSMANFDAAKAARDKELQALNAFFKSQQDGWQFANTYLQGAYSQGLTSLSDFFTSQKAIRDADLKSQLDMLDKSISIERAYLKKLPGGDAGAKEQMATRNKIIELEGKKAEAVQKASQADILAYQKEEAQVKALDDRVAELQATLLDLSGDTLGAAALRSAKQVDDAVKLLTQAGKDVGLADNYKKLLDLTARLRQQQTDYSRFSTQAAMQEDKLAQDAITNNTLQNDLMRQQRDLRKEQLEQLGKLVDKANELALELGTPEAIDNALALGAAFRRAANDVDPFLTKLRDTSKELGDSLAGIAENAILNFTSLRDVLKALEQDILRIVTRRAITEPLGDWIGKSILGGPGGNPLSGVGGWLYNLMGGGRAFGGPVEAGKLYSVNERGGPELLDVNGRQFLMMGASNGTVRPASQAGQQVIHQTFVLQGKTDLRTQSQVAAAAAAGLARASMRNN